MAVTDFDRFRATYVENLERAIGPVGDPELFTEVKAEALLDLASRLVGPPRELSFLDVGCGPGLTDSLLVPDVGAMTGADVSAAMIERARAANPTARYELYDGRRLPFADGSFAVSFAICVLHHIDPPQRPAFAAELARVTRRGGIVVVMEHNPVNPMTRIVVSRCEFDEGVQLLPVRETKSLLAAAAAPPVESRYILFFPWDAAVFRRAERSLASVPLGAQYAVAGRCQ